MFDSKLIMGIAAGYGAVAVMLGAFGAHGLKNLLGESQLAVWQTAVQYQFYHAIALLVVGVLMLHGWSSIWLRLSSGLFVCGVVLFSGSLYGLALGGPKILGPVTPLGGLAFIGGWLALVVAVVKS